MIYQSKKKLLKELNLLNRFLFDETMEDLEIYRTSLEIVLEREVRLLGRPQSEKEVRTLPSFRGIRMDVWGEDEDRAIYNSEMQGRNTRNLPRRSRFYQSVLDAGQMEPGSVDFNSLCDVYLITIAPFDLFGEGRYRYTFRMRCDESPELSLGDGAVRIFLNTRGTRRDEIPEELYEFLCYIEHSDEETAKGLKSERVKKLHKRVAKVKSNEASEVKYMQLWEEKIIERMEAREEGLEEGREEGREEGLEKGRVEGLKLVNRLNQMLIRDGRLDELLEAASNPEVQSSLMKEYGLMA